MSDSTFQKGLTALTIVVVLAAAAAIAFGRMRPISVILGGLLVEILGGGAMLYFWGKAYMSRR